MATVKLGINRLGPDDVVDLANTIKTAMTGNANFATPNPSLASLGTLITAATTKIAAVNTAQTTLQTAISDRDAAVDALKAALTQEAAYVQNASGGDATKIQSAGMQIKGPPNPIGPLPQVPNLVVTAGANDGTLDASWDPVYGANSYEIQTSVDPGTSSSWAFKMSATRSNATMNSFTSGDRMWVRVRAIGANNSNGPWSDPATKTVP
jgi:hypothetical protein